MSKTTIINLNPDAGAEKIALLRIHVNQMCQSCNGFTLISEEKSIKFQGGVGMEGSMSFDEVLTIADNLIAGLQQFRVEALDYCVKAVSVRVKSAKKNLEDLKLAENTMDRGMFEERLSNAQKNYQHYKSMLLRYEGMLNIKDQEVELSEKK